MKIQLLGLTAGAALALAMLFGATQTFVSGQEKEGVASPATYRRFTRSIQGVWRTTVTQRNCQTGDAIRTSVGLTTFHEGGTISETSAALSPALRSPAHGVWEKESPTTYSGSFIFLRFNPDGTYAGTQKISITNVLGGRNGTTYDSTASIQIFDANDNLIGNGCATSIGSRFE